MPGPGHRPEPFITALLEQMTLAEKRCGCCCRPTGSRSETRGMRRVVEPGASDVLVGRSAHDVLLSAELVVLPEDRPPGSRGTGLS